MRARVDSNSVSLADSLTLNNRESMIGLPKPPIAMRAHPISQDDEMPVTKVVPSPPRKAAANPIARPARLSLVNQTNSPLNVSSSQDIACENNPTTQEESFTLPSLTPRASAKVIPQLFLPEYKFDPSKVMLVLDIDETIVHSSLTQIRGCHFAIDVPYKGRRHKVYVTLRPHLRTFLRFIATRFETCVFTASIHEYAEALMNKIDPRGKLGSMRLHREHCQIVDGALVKNLGYIGKPVDRVVIIDNSPQSYALHPDNALPVSSFYGNNLDDTALLRLLPFLERLTALQPHVSVYEVARDYQEN